jgi:hypothetical protein
MASIPSVCMYMQQLKSIAYFFVLILFITQNGFAKRSSYNTNFNPASPTFSFLTLVCPPDISVSITGNACAATILLPTLQVTSTGCNSLYSTQISSPLGNGYGPFYNVPQGTYLIDCKVFNVCGDTSFCSFKLNVRDTKKPITLLKSALYCNISMDGMVKVNARLLNQNSYDNCTNSSALSYSFSANPLDTIRVFDCNQLGIHPVTVSVHDESGNKANGLSQIVVQDGMNYCQTSAITASSSTATNSIITDVKYELITTDYSESVMSTNGQASFDQLPLNDYYTIKPSKNDNWVNGLNVYDLKLLQRHLNGIEILNSPLKIIAADINRSGTVSFTDFQLLRSLILGEISTINQNTSWRFLPKNQVFTNPLNPFSTNFIEQINLNGLNTGNNISLFSGIKIGDLNGSAIPSFEETAPSNLRKNNQSINLTAENQSIKSGDIVQISLTVSSSIEEITDYQLTLDFNMNNLSFQSASPSNYPDMGFGNVGLAHINDGAITIINNRIPSENEEDNHIIKATFKAISDGNLSESLQISDRITPSAAFDKDGNKYNLNLNFNEKPITEGSLKLFSNFPNPFIEMTLLRFSIPEADEVTINIFDAQGKSIYEHKQDFSKGEQQVLLQRSDIGNAGIYSYQIVSKFGIATRKLIMF